MAQPSESQVLLIQVLQPIAKKQDSYIKDKKPKSLKDFLVCVKIPP